MWCVGLTLALVVWFLVDALALSGHESEWSLMRRLGRWWDKRFPRKDNPARRGFEIQGRKKGRL